MEREPTDWTFSEEDQPAADIVLRAVPDDLRDFDTFIAAEVLAIVEGERDEEVLVEATSDYASILRSTIEGYRRLGRMATNRRSVAVRAFG